MQAKSGEKREFDDERRTKIQNRCSVTREKHAVSFKESGAFSQQELEFIANNDTLMSFTYLCHFIK